MTSLTIVGARRQSAASATASFEVSIESAGARARRARRPPARCARRSSSAPTGSAPGPGRLAADVEDLGALGDQLAPVLDRPLGIEEQPAVGERVGRDVDHPHDPGARCRSTSSIKRCQRLRRRPLAGGDRAVHVAVPDRRRLRARPVDRARSARAAPGRARSRRRAAGSRRSSRATRGRPPRPCRRSARASRPAAPKKRCRQPSTISRRSASGRSVACRAARALEEGEQHPRRAVGGRVVVGDRDRAVGARRLAREPLVAPERPLVDRHALDDAALRHPLGEAVANRRQRRLVVDPAGQRRRHRDDRPPGPHGRAARRSRVDPVRRRARSGAPAPRARPRRRAARPSAARSAACRRRPASPARRPRCRSRRSNEPAERM